MNTGKCPKCDKLLTSAKIEPIELRQGMRAKWNGASILCPWCFAILSISLDPIALKTDIINGVIAALGKRK